MYCSVQMSLFLLALLGMVFCYNAGRFARKRVKNSGETRVRQALLAYCEGREAHVLSDITLRLVDGSTTQIDHILISSKGIFVVETKHYNGWLFGSTKNKFWTQTTYYDKYKFQNPLLQNYKHVKAIRSLFEFLDPKLTHNIVVFSGEAVFKSDKPSNVLYIKELISVIEQYPDGALSLNRIQFCVGRLEYTRLALTRKTDVDHQEYLNQKFGTEL